MDFGVLLLIIFILAPLLEKLLKAGGPPPPPQAPPGQRPQPPQRAQPRERGDVEPWAPARPQPYGGGPVDVADDDEADEDEDIAADMLPDDLWQILTGERREPAARAPAPAPPQPQPQQRPPAPRPTGVQPRPSAPRPAPAPPAPRQPRRPEVVHLPPVHEPPVVVSMETPLEDSETRYARFQRRRANLPSAARVQRRREANPYRFTSAAELRRAIVLAEILGPPRGLE